MKTFRKILGVLAAVAAVILTVIITNVLAILAGIDPIYFGNGIIGLALMIGRLAICIIVAASTYRLVAGKSSSGSVNN